MENSQKKNAKHVLFMHHDEKGKGFSFLPEPSFLSLEQMTKSQVSCCK